MTNLWESKAKRVHVNSYCCGFTGNRSLAITLIQTEPQITELNMNLTGIDNSESNCSLTELTQFTIFWTNLGPLTIVWTKISYSNQNLRLSCSTVITKYNQPEFTKHRDYFLFMGYYCKEGSAILCCMSSRPSIWKIHWLLQYQIGTVNYCAVSVLNLFRVFFW